MTELTGTSSAGKRLGSTGKLVFAHRSDVGLVRDHNEDSLIAIPPLFAVCDGMGGHEAGEVASRIAVETIVDAAPAHADGRALGRAVIAANKAVMQGAADGTGKPGMGTTCSALMIENDRAVIAQVGDSRVYLLRDGLIKQLTRDHSLVAEMIAAGRITEDEARVHPQRSVITRALGSDDDMVPDIFELVLEPKDRLLVNSDGLSSMVPNDRIEAIMAESETPAACVDALVEAALEAGGHDNISVVVVDLPDTLERTAPTPSATGVFPVAVSPADEGTEDLEPSPAEDDDDDQVDNGLRVGTHTDDAAVEAETQRRHNSKRLRIAIISFIVALVVIVGAAVGGTYAYARHSAYLIEEDGVVAVYQGFPDTVMGLTLKWPVKTTDIKVADLPSSVADRLSEGIRTGSVEEADELLTSYREQIAEAQAQKPDAANAAGKTGSAPAATSATGTTAPSTTEKKDTAAPAATGSSSSSSTAAPSQSAPTATNQKTGA